MAFSYTVTERMVFSNKRYLYGTYTNAGGDTGGEIVTGLGQVDYFQLQPKGSAILVTAPVVDETFPLINSTGTVTVVNADGEDGQWFAFGI